MMANQGSYDQLAQFGTLWFSCDTCGELHPDDEFQVISDIVWHGDHLAQDISGEDLEKVINWFKAEQDQAYQAYRDDEDKPGYAYEDHR